MHRSMEKRKLKRKGERETGRERGRKRSTQPAQILSRISSCSGLPGTTRPLVSSFISRRGAGDVLKYEDSNKPFIFLTIAQLT